MKVNKQTDIKVPKSGFKRSKFNWSHDVNTTFTWGEIQPTQCKMLIPNSKTTMQAQNLIRLSPMVAPTFGRVKYKTFNQFVPIADVFPNFDSMMAQEPISRNGIVRVPQHIPTIRLGYLSAYVLFGARATIYWAHANSTTDRRAAAAKGQYYTSYRHPNAAYTSWLLDTEADKIYNMLLSEDIVSVQSGIPGASGVLPDVANSGAATLTLQLGAIANTKMQYLYSSKLFDPYDVNQMFLVSLGLKDPMQLFPIDRAIDRNENWALYDELDDTDFEVTFDGADYVLEFEITDPNDSTAVYPVAIAFELSDFGKRIRKVIQGCGYQIDLSSTQEVSILPLLAQYKAYFDVFGLTLYQGWETTACAKLIDYISTRFYETIGTEAGGTYRIFELPAISPTRITPNVQNMLFVDFMLGELANEWYTDSADYISAHLPRLAVSPNVSYPGFISADSTGLNNTSVVSNNNINGTDLTTDGQQANDTDNIWTGIDIGDTPYISQIEHGQVDTEVLMRVYRWTNRNSILGRTIAKILRAQGLGKYVDECKSNYIGATDTLVTISDVVSTAATADAALGEYGGRGLQYTSDETLVFENDSYGYWITLATIVPEAGYTQGLDPTLSAVEKFSLYNPDFDAIGMELTSKTTVVGSRYCVGMESVNAQKDGFGFIPRYSKFKVAQNLVNGDFNRHNLRKTYLPYTLDKQLNVNDFDSDYVRYNQASGNNFSDNYTGFKRSITTESMPVAGNIWRIPTKYAWLGNFNRIFLKVGKHDDDDNAGQTYAANAIVGFSDYNEDNFLSHGIYGVTCYAPMKPIEDSYGLEEADPNEVGADYMKKA